MAVKLTEANLKALEPQVRVPAYDRRQVGQAIVHIGVGGFHRAHQAVYADDLLHRPEAERQWGLCGVGLLAHDARMREVLRAQDCLYTVVERSAAGDRARVIGSLMAFLYGPEQRERILETMASADCRIVSLTITEGGYYLHQGTGQFDAQHPDIQHDLAHPQEPRCSFGYLLEALNRRRQRGLGPFTALSCDNIQSNGEVLKKMLLAFAELREPALSTWLAENGAFPNSMVDRITPATTDEHRALVRERFGLEDGWPVMTEPFKQWVIEDHFLQGRPRWEAVGAQMTSDVLPYEKMKLRLLNASHQAMCYIGMLLGYEFAHEAMADGQIQSLVAAMMDQEVTPLLSPVPGIDLAAYKATLLERFANPAIRDQLARIGTEGSARIPKFVLPSIEERLARGGPMRRLCFTVASWFRYLQGQDQGGKPLPINDPLAEPLREAARAGGPDPGPLLALRAVFSEHVAQAPPFVEEVRRALQGFYAEGARATLAQYAQP